MNLARPLLKPKHLSKGSRIGIVTVSEPVVDADLDKGIEWLSNEGFDVVLANHARSRSGHLAGSDEERSSDLNALFSDKSIDAIFCSAGGANSARLLPLIDYSAIAANPKIFLGISDPTILLCAIYARTGLVTFHGPVVQYNFSKPMTPFTEKYFRRALLSIEPIGVIDEVGTGNVLKKGNRVTGPLIGGNLTTLQQLLGTPYEPSWDGAILFWEDVCEQPHALDAKLTHFRNAGVFERIAGMIVGNLEACEEQDYEDMPPIDEIILHLTDGHDFPILHHIDLGHTDSKLTIPIGVAADVDGDSGLLRIGERCVV